MTKKELIAKLLADESPDDVIIVDGYQGLPIDGDLIFVKDKNELIVS